MRAIPASSPSEANPDRLPTGKASQKTVVCSTHTSRVRLAKRFGPMQACRNAERASKSRGRRVGAEPD